MSDSSEDQSDTMEKKDQEAETFLKDRSEIIFTMDNRYVN